MRISTTNDAPECGWTRARRAIARQNTITTATTATATTLTAANANGAAMTRAAHRLPNGWRVKPPL
eukprot:11179638-Lingulodinium_polyedra.AAC.1